ncbi:MAG: DUF2769 domain-containing protein [Candidatus Bathyarchaeota archaeon]|nr:DUF2769 domain-containing protein [Candidatus Bathyarchaeota archaeon]
MDSELILGLTIRNIIEGGRTPPVVHFTLENYRRCLCPGCMVQSGSVCVEGKRAKLPDVDEERWGVLASKPELLPVLYCSSGRTDCRDIDTLRMCRCSGCPTFVKYRLSEGRPKSYFCRDGCQVLCKD